MKEYFKNYFNSAEPICGEEKQYALFFYNKLLAIKGKRILKEEDLAVLRTCGIEGEKIKILSVAYEATYMRDIFTQEKQDRKGGNNVERCIGETDGGETSFNEMLFSYVNRMYRVPMEAVYMNRNFGKGKIFKISAKEETQPPQMIDILKGMMNLKPDIALFYLQDGVRHLKLLECKYLSGESMNKGITRTQLMEMVAGFLCERIQAESGEEVIPENGTVYFVSKKNENWKCMAEAPERCIRVENLIPKALG